MSWEAAEHEAGDTFAQVFYLFWIGSAVITINAKLLKGNVSFFQSVCAIGYCLFPLVMGSVIATILLVFSRSVVSSIMYKVIDGLRIFLVLGCLVWSCRAATVFLKEFMGEKRRILAVYPVALLYASFSWLILT